MSICAGTSPQECRSMAYVFRLLDFTHNADLFLWYEAFRRGTFRQESDEACRRTARSFNTRKIGKPGPTMIAEGTHSAHHRSLLLHVRFQLMSLPFTQLRCNPRLGSCSLYTASVVWLESPVACTASQTPGGMRHESCAQNQNSALHVDTAHLNKASEPPRLGMSCGLLR